MSAITNKWNDGSGDSINIESPSFQGNQTVKISSPVQKGTSKRSMKFIGKCKKDSSKQVILTVEQEASVYTYDLILSSDNTEIAAKGGTANITAILKTYRNGNLVSTDNVTPVLSGSATGFSISGVTVTASNRTTIVGTERSITVTGKFSNTFDGQTVSANIVIKQEANSQTLRETTNRYTSSNPLTGQNTVKANGGTVWVYTFAIYDYTSGDSSETNISNECTFGSVTFGTWDSAKHTWTCPSAGTTVYSEHRGTSIKVTWGSKKTTYYLYQEKNLESIKSTSGGVYTYGDIVTGAISNKTIPASGGSATATAGNGSQTWNKSATITTYEYTSGATKDVTTEAASSGTANVVPNVASITATASSKGTTVSAQTTVKSQAVTWSANGKSASETMYIYQEANTVLYSDITITKETPINLSAYMHINIKVSDGLSYSQKATYTSSATTDITTGANITYSVQNPVTGFTLSNNILRVTSNKSLNPRNGFIVRINILLNGKTAIKDITYNQAAGYYTYANPVVTLTCNDVPASGGSVKTGNVTYSQTYGWNGTTTGAGVITEGEAYIYWTGGVNNIPSLGTTVKSRTKVGVLGVTVNINGKSGNTSADIYQAENKVTNSNYNPRITAYGTPTISIGSGLTAAGGSASVSASVTNTETYNALYSSGATGPNQTRSVGGSISISMTVNGNSRFSLSGNTITHSSMGTNVTTDTAKFRCYNESDRTKYVDDSISVSNRIESYNYGSWNISISANPTSLPATGGTSTITSSCTRSKTPVYTSGSTGTATTESATSTLALTTNPGGFTLNGNKLTAANNPIGAKTATVTASYSNAPSKSVIVSQAAGPDGIGYMQIQGDGTSHPIFRVGGNTRSVEPMSINETSETASDEDVSIFASIKKFLTKFV